ncbi:hypothetical protein [Butyrivibrio sp. INlla21]|uniref:hypothetical protein n=1 Tax=Butyrivibrio sp. INlla21 TaxID=1520811 RepID=UPI0008E87ECC|nr:hypothetical protein [Butyrivibrio sp. INlla21]SFU32359.1 hypothetical protein SAMN02910342_00073 [Butyrivibrio sp. INlla21]
MTKKYTVSKGTNDGNLAFAWQLSCNGKHVQWFSDESIARKTCDELTSIELIKENTKTETVTEFADRCRECGRERVLDKIRAKIELEKLGYPPSAGYYKAIMKCLQIIDKYKAESEDKK